MQVCPFNRSRHLENTNELILLVKNGSSGAGPAVVLLTKMLRPETELAAVKSVPAHTIITNFILSPTGTGQEVDIFALG